MAKTYGWTGTLSTDFGTPGNWDDFTDGLNPSPTAPGTLDSVSFSNFGGTVSGTGTVDTISFNQSFTLPRPSWTVTGTLDAIGGGITNNGVTLTITATGVLDGTEYAQYGTDPVTDLEMQAGSKMTLTGMASGYLPDAFNLDGTGTINGGTVDASGGGAIINGELTAEGGATVEVLYTNLSLGGYPAGTLTITGPDTTWHDIGSYEVVNGFTYNAGYMNVSGQGVALLVEDDAALTDDGSGNLDDAATATISGGAVWDVGDQANLDYGAAATITSGGVWNVGGDTGVALSVGYNGSGSVSVASGGTLHTTGTWDFIGNGVGGEGSVTVDGEGSDYSSSGSIIIGQYGSGTLEVGDDAYVSAGVGVAVGQLDGSTGILTIEVGGTVDSTGTDDGAITVGNVAGSTGVVYVEAGSTLEATAALDPDNYYLEIGRNGSTTSASGDVTPAANGAIYVEGAGALLTTNGNPARIGANGNGTLSVTDGATASFGVSSDASTADAALSVGRNSGGNGTVIVSGTGSSLTSAGDTYFAHAGTAALTVSNGATFTAGDATDGLYIGFGNSGGTGGSATASVTSGGYVKSLSNVEVGIGGDTGTLHITGGTVEATDRALVGIANTISNGSEAGGTGIVTIGAGGTLLADGSNITASGTSSIGIGFGAGSTGTIDVSGAAALLDSGRNYIQIGNNGGTGVLSVSDGGTVEATTQFAANAATELGDGGSSGYVVISGTLSTYDADGQFDVGTSGTGVLQVSSGGTLITGNNPVFARGGLVVGWGAGSTGNITVTGTGSEILNTGQFNVGGSGNNGLPTGGTGSMTIEDGGLVQTSLPATGYTGPAADIAADPGTDGSSVTVTGTKSTWSIGGALLVGDAASGALSIDSAGTVTATSADIGVQAGSAGVVSVSGAGTLAVTGSLTVGDAASGQLSIFSAGTVTAGSLTIGAQTTGDGFVDLDGASSLLDVSGAITIGGSGNAALDIGNGAEVIGGSVTIGLDGVVTMLGGELDPPTGTLPNAGIIGGHGTIDSNVDNTGTIYASGGTEEVTGDITDSGGFLVMNNHGNLKLDGAVSSGQTALFTTANGTLTLEDPADFAGNISGFKAGDLIVAVGATSGTLNGDVLDLFAGTTPDGSLTFSNPPPLFVAADGDVVTCFLAGTSIAGEAGEVPVEHLVAGDRVRTHAGEVARVAWIGYRSIACDRHPKPQAVWPVRIRAGAFGGGLPLRDLLLSPEHAVFTDGMLVPIRCLVNGVTIAQEPADTVTYYHVELARHDVILAEGLPCESYLDTGNRAMFANCPVTELYPAFARDAGHAWLHDACAPLVEGGPRLDAISRRLRALAGLAEDDPAAHQSGELRGWIDSATRDEISGWAWQPDHPCHFVRLEILAGDTVLGETLATEQRDDVRDAGRLHITAGDRVPGNTVADENRPDPREAGHGDGRCGFTFRLPQPLSPFASHTIRVRRAADHAELWNSGQVTIAAAARLDASALDGFAAALRATAATAGEAERDALARFMASAIDDLRTVCARTQVGGAGASQPLALFIDEVLPAPDRDSASQVALDHMRALQALGYRVAFAAGNPGGDAAPLTALGVTVCLPPVMASVEDALRRLGAEATLVYLHRVGTATLYAPLVRHHCPKALLVYSVADLHFLRFARQAVVAGSGSLAAESRRLREQELRAAAMADRVITHSPAEAAILRQQAPQARVHVVPWSTAAEPTEVPFAQRRGLAFIGGYRHAPNVDAARWLVDSIMPLVWQQDPDIECLLVGSDMPDSLRRLTRAGIVPLGHVADLATVFDRVRLTVAPLRFGAGLKGKVLHSFAHGAPCVMTPIAAEGFSLDGALAGLVVAEPAALAAAICRLHTDAAAHASATDAGLALVASAFSEQAVDAALGRAIRLRAADRCAA